MACAEFDVEKASRELTGAPAELAARLGTLIRTPPAPPAGTSTVQLRRAAIAESMRGCEISTLKHRLAVEFGAAHGWHVTRKAFTPAVLARGGVWDGRAVCALSCWPREFADHPFFYRLGNRAAALASHPYELSPATRDAARTWAERNGLSVSFPEGFPSWWFPGSTTLVLFTRAAAGAGNASR